MKDALREEVLHAARSLFLEKGFDAVGMREIAQAVGRQPTQVYRLELSKTDILAEIIVALNQEQIEKLPAMVARIKGKTALDNIGKDLVAELDRLKVVVERVVLVCRHERGAVLVLVQRQPFRALGSVGWHLAFVIDVELYILGPKLIK